MPTYQYRCTACSEPLEVVQSFTDPPLTDCPSCAGSLRKVFSAVGVVFKGSGFYKNDSRPAPKGDSPAKDGDAAKAPAASADGGGRADGSKADKPAEKPAEKSKSDKPAKKSPSSSGTHKVA